MDEVAENNQANIAEADKPALATWSYSKLIRAGKMLKNGYSPEQVGSELRLSRAEVDQLKIDVEDEPKVEDESFEAWRKRASERVERKTVGIVERHLDAVDRMTDVSQLPLDPDTMGTVKDAAAIGYQWLRKGEEQVKQKLTVDFTVLANAQRALPSAPTINLPSE